MTPSEILNGGRDVKLIVLHATGTDNAETLFSGKYGTPGFASPMGYVDIIHQSRGLLRESYWRGRQNSQVMACGFHFLIARNGAIFSGRHLHEPGEHAQGWNAASVGICLVGTDQFTEVQWLALESCVRGLSVRFQIPLGAPKLMTRDGQGFVVGRGIAGVGDLPGHKAASCGFSVNAWLANGLQSLKAHTEASHAIA